MLTPDQLEQRYLTTVTKLNQTTEFGNNELPTGPMRGDRLKALYKDLAPIVTGATANGELSNQDAKRFFEANSQINPPKPTRAPAPGR